MPTIKSWFVIINPTSGKGLGKRKWPRIERALHQAGIEFDHAFTAYDGHSRKLTHLAVNQGFSNVICIGGDGTIHNVVNGIMTQKSLPSTQVRLGIIPIGTGNDWVRSYGIPRQIEKAIAIIKKGRVHQQDVGCIDLRSGNQEREFFNNLTGVGFDGFVVSQVDRFKRLGVLAYMIAALIGIFRFRNFDVSVRFDNSEKQTKALMVLIGLCSYSGGGMRLTDNPDPTDGQFDISIASNFSTFDFIKNIRNVYSGQISKIKKVEISKASQLSVTINESKTQQIQADGELIGGGNFDVSIIPMALSFYA